MLSLPSKISITEVAPRDGLQSFKQPVDTETKVRIVDRLSDAGLPVIEVTGFAHPRAIPNLADAEEVFARIRRRPGTVYRGLAPNARGADRAIKAHADEILGLTIVSDAYLKKNQNMTADKAIDEAVLAFRAAERANTRFVMALGMAFWCPYEGAIAKERVLNLLGRLRNAGITRFYLAGSVGMEDPRHVSELFARGLEAYPDVELGFHVHNMSGMATANILAALDSGASFIEGAICGLGGGIAMPNSLGSVGNFPTEDLVAMLELMGVSTGVSPQAVTEAAIDIAAMLNVTPRSHAGQGVSRASIRSTPVLAE